MESLRSAERARRAASDVVYELVSTGEVATALEALHAALVAEATVAQTVAPEDSRARDGWAAERYAVMAGAARPG